MSDYDLISLPEGEDFFSEVEEEISFSISGSFLDVDTKLRLETSAILRSVLQLRSAFNLRISLKVLDVSVSNAAQITIRDAQTGQLTLTFTNRTLLVGGIPVTIDKTKIGNTNTFILRRTSISALVELYVVYEGTTTGATYLGKFVTSPLTDQEGTYIHAVGSPVLLSEFRLSSSALSIPKGPTAVVLAPSTAEVGVPVTLDGSASTSSTGTQLSYVWNFIDYPSDTEPVLGGRSFASAVVGPLTIVAKLPGASGNLLSVEVVNPSTDQLATQVELNEGEAGFPTLSIVAKRISGINSTRADEVIAAINQGEASKYYFASLNTGFSVGAKVPYTSLTSFTGGSSSNSPITSFVPDTSGLYRVSLIVSDAEFTSLPVEIDFFVKERSLTLGTIPDVSSLWEGVSSFWSQFKDKELIENLWIGLAHLGTNLLTHIYQSDLSRSLQQAPTKLIKWWDCIPLRYPVSLVTQYPLQGRTEEIFISFISSGELSSRIFFSTHNLLSEWLLLTNEKTVLRITSKYANEDGGYTYIVDRDVPVFTVITKERAQVTSTNTIRTSRILPSTTTHIRINKKAFAIDSREGRDISFASGANLQVGKVVVVEALQARLTLTAANYAAIEVAEEVPIKEGWAVYNAPIRIVGNRDNKVFLLETQIPTNQTLLYLQRSPLQIPLDNIPTSLTHIWISPTEPIFFKEGINFTLRDGDIVFSSFDTPTESVTEESFLNYENLWIEKSTYSINELLYQNFGSIFEVEEVDTTSEYLTVLRIISWALHRGPSLDTLHAVASSMLGLSVVDVVEGVVVEISDNYLSNKAVLVLRDDSNNLRTYPFLRSMGLRALERLGNRPPVVGDTLRIGDVLENGVVIKDYINSKQFDIVFKALGFLHTLDYLYTGYLDITFSRITESTIGVLQGLLGKLLQTDRKLLVVSSIGATDDILPVEIVTKEIQHEVVESLCQPNARAFIFDKVDGSGNPTTFFDGETFDPPIPFYFDEEEIVGPCITSFASVFGYTEGEELRFDEGFYFDAGIVEDYNDVTPSFDSTDGHLFTWWFDTPLVTDFSGSSTESVNMDIEGEQFTEVVVYEPDLSADEYTGWIGTVVDDATETLYGDVALATWASSNEKPYIDEVDAPAVDSEDSGYAITVYGFFFDRVLTAFESVRLYNITEDVEFSDQTNNIEIDSTGGSYLLTPDYSVGDNRQYFTVNVDLQLPAGFYQLRIITDEGTEEEHSTVATTLFEVTEA